MLGVIWGEGDWIANLGPDHEDPQRHMKEFRSAFSIWMFYESFQLYLLVKNSQKSSSVDLSDFIVTLYINNYKTTIMSLYL